MQLTHILTECSPVSQAIPGGLVVRIRRFHRRGRGSIPRLGVYFAAHPVTPTCPRRPLLFKWGSSIRENCSIQRKPLLLKNAQTAPQNISIFIIRPASYLDPAPSIDMVTARFFSMYLQKMLKRLIRSYVKYLSTEPIEEDATQNARIWPFIMITIKYLIFSYWH